MLSLTTLRQRTAGRRSPPRGAPAPSTQATQLDIEDIADGIVRLTSGHSRAVLEVEGSNFSLLDEGEQDALLAGFAAFLNGLAFPVQLLVRVLPIDVGRYLGELEHVAST